MRSWLNDLLGVFEREMMSNPNNCETCDNMVLNGNRDGHCHMFQCAPKDVCLKHTGRQVTWPLAILDALNDRPCASGKSVISKCVRQGAHHGNKRRNG